MHAVLQIQEFLAENSIKKFHAELQFWVLGNVFLQIVDKI